MRACAIETHIHGHVTRASLCENLQELDPRLRKRTWACDKSIQEPFYARIFRINAAPQKLAARFLRLACAVEMHLDISQEQFHARIYTKKAAPQRRGADFVQACAVGNALGHLIRAISCENFRKNAGDQSAHPDLTLASTPTVRTPQCGHTVWGTRVHEINVDTFHEMNPGKTINRT